MIKDVQELKRPPTLFDSVMATMATYSSRAAGTELFPSRMKMLQAQRFVLDTDASKFIGEMQAGNPFLVMNQHEFARAPYPLCWIEFDYDAFLTSVDRAWQIDRTTDTHMGILYDHGTVWIASMIWKPRNGNIKAGMFVPYKIHMHQPIDASQELDIAQQCGLSRLTYRHMLLGINDKLALEHQAEITAICRAHRIEPHPMLTELSIEKRSNMATQMTGILRQVIALLLMMSRPLRAEYFQELPVQAKQGFIGNKLRPLVSYTHLSVHLERRLEAIRYFATGDKVSSGRHEKWHTVRGHWCQSRKKGKGCDHDWQPVTKDKYECTLCEAKRWWREYPNGKGDIEKGTIVKTYEVHR